MNICVYVYMYSVYVYASVYSTTTKSYRIQTERIEDVCAVLKQSIQNHSLLQRLIVISHTKSTS